MAPIETLDILAKVQSRDHHEAQVLVLIGIRLALHDTESGRTLMYHVSFRRMPSLLHPSPAA